MIALFSVLGIVVGLPACFVVAFKDFGTAEERVTLQSQSPDGSRRVILRELPGFMDRNFSLVLENLRTGQTNEVFSSPDEGLPGSERIVWSEDSTRFLLLGTNFHTLNHADLPGGEQLYLVYDTVSGSLCCNAAQQSKYESFTTNDITATKWMGF
ncbi:MAG TPA: hypothetical protein VEC99_10485 [Clostridia bacterium]|nr:hypothetical protein [Clostridia bacterium]